MTGTLISGNRSTASRRRDTKPSTTVISDIIRLNAGCRSARRVSHMGERPPLVRPGGVARVAGSLRGDERVGSARGAHLHALAHPLRACDDDLFAGFQAGLDLEPIAAVHAQGERAA